MKPEIQSVGARFARFGVVGALGVGVNSLVLFVAHGVAGLPLLVASPLAVELAVLNNFFWNERWTFGASGFSPRRLAKFNLTSLGGMVIASGVLYLLVAYGGFHYLMANLVGISLAVLWNFTTSLLWTWGLEP